MPLLSRKEVSAAYGRIETKFKRLKRDLTEAGLEKDALANIFETLDAQQLKQVADIHNQPAEVRQDPAL